MLSIRFICCLFLMTLLLIGALPMLKAQNSKRGITYVAPPPPFMPNEAQLNELMETLTCVLNGDGDVQKLEKYFFNQTLAEAYTGYLESENVPEITKRAAPAFVQMSEPVRQYVIKNAGKVKSVKVVATRQRFGVSEQMKIVAPTLHLTYKDEMLEQIKLQLIDYDGYYRILSFDE